MWARTIKLTYVGTSLLDGHVYPGSIERSCQLYIWRNPRGFRINSERSCRSSARAEAINSSFDSVDGSLSPSILLQESEKIESAKEQASSIRIQAIESFIERKIFNCRFLTLMAVTGSLAGSFLCFAKGCLLIVSAFREYYQSCLVGLGTGKVIFLLVEALDVYLMGTVMLIFGMGLYELFVSTFETTNQEGSSSKPPILQGSNLFGLFRLRERPGWLEIRSLDQLKTKLGHVIVMILLVGMFEKSKKVVVNTAVDLVSFALSIFLASASLYLLSKLNHN